MRSMQDTSRSLLIPVHKLESMSKLLERARKQHRRNLKIYLFLLLQQKEIEKLAGYELNFVESYVRCVASR